MSFSTRSGRKITRPVRFIDIADGFESWSRSEDEGLESSGSDGVGKAVENISNDSNLLLPIEGNNSKKIIRKKKLTKRVSRVTGKVNEGAGTSTGNVHVPPFYRPDLPSPNSPHVGNVSVPQSLPQIQNLPGKNVCVDTIAAANVSAKGKGKAGKKSKAKDLGYRWLNIDTPIDHVEREFDYTPILPFLVNQIVYQPIDFFHLLFDDGIYNVILTETNHYCTNCPESTPLPGWVDITKPELSAFLGVMIGAGINKIPRLESIWSSDWSIGLPNYAKIMPKARFFEIKSHLHFNDNCKTPDRDHPNYKLHKIQPIITRCTENFRAHYRLHQEVCVDESITRFKGRNSMKQYDASKPIKRGFKWWTLADSYSGYVYNMKMYTGKDLDKDKKKGPTGSRGPAHVPVGNASEGQPANDPEEAEALGTRAVMSVVSPHIEHKNHVVFVDRFFSSLPLMKKLSEVGIYICGTIQKNRIGIPDCIKDPNTHFERGDSHYVVEQGTSAQLLVWQDRKLIHFINNFYACEGVDYVRRKLPKQRGAVIHVPCPPAVLAYNKHMNGVDMADQIRQVYSIDRRSKRWPMRLFWHCFDTCIANAYILYSEYLRARGVLRKNIPDQFLFRRFLLKSLIGSYTSRKKMGRPSLDPPPQPRLGPNPHTLGDLRLHGVPKKRCCVVCLKRKLRRESFFGCIQCGITLCRFVTNKCFEIYHTQLIIE